ncbi:DUF4232 domain-containing protein [Streptomyces sp. NPDC059477]|uniref:DUF4232 domain-containing protein n=1 Tax=Streptomyces sp. NPDC059477 TaxID=3346847 RepID=UPI0036C001DC
MRTFRHARLLAATGAALTALALTACENGTGTRDEGASTTVEDQNTPEPSTTKENTGSEAAGATGTATPATVPATPDDASDNTPDDTPDDTPAELTICNGSNTTTTVQQVPRPLNHALLTVTNTGSRTCALMYAPVLRFDEMQWVPQTMEDSRPQSVPMLEPGGSGYAGVRLSAGDGSGTGGDTGRKLTIAFQGRTPNSDGGPSATPALPAGGVYYDSALSVTYWQADVEAALY